jgi:hypothetical protein
VDHDLGQWPALQEAETRLVLHFGRHRPQGIR